MKILAIETSCDETGLAVLEAKGGFKKPFFKIKKNLIASQIKIHKKYGGVVPFLAKREHQKNLPILFQKIFKKNKNINFDKEKFDKIFKKITKNRTINEKQEIDFYKKLKNIISKTKKPDIDLIAVTSQPGLTPCLWQGINFAKIISCYWQIPILGIDHIEAHIFSVFLKNNFSFKFPTLSLVVSGGHTYLVLIKNWFKYKIIGQTQDDALGEAFDKVGKILGLDYPAGPEIEKRAKLGKDIFNFPSPMISQKNFNFSFSGLKTAVYYQFLKDKKQKIRFSEKRINDYCASFQKAAFKVLEKKSKLALERFKTKQFILAGGVAANKTLQKLLKKSLTTEFYVPDLKFSTDNGAMVGAASYFRSLKTKPRPCQNLEAKSEIKI